MKDGLESLCTSQERFIFAVASLCCHFPFYWKLNHKSYPEKKCNIFKIAKWQMTENFLLSNLDDKLPVWKYANNIQSAFQFSKLFFEKIWSQTLFLFNARKIQIWKLKCFQKSRIKMVQNSVFFKTTFQAIFVKLSIKSF